MKKLFSILTVFVLLLSLTVTCFATSNIPVFDVDADFETYPYAIAMEFPAGYYRVYMMSDKPVQNGASMKSQGPYIHYMYVNEKWVYQGRQSNGYSFSLIGDTGVPVHSTFDVYYNNELVCSADPEFFFPPTPLAELVLEVTEEELVEVTIPEMVGSMKILVPCGVGLMALLMGLSLFGKRSLIFRS